MSAADAEVDEGTRRRPGRPTLYDPDVMLPRVREWAEAGLTQEQIAANLGIAAGTLYEWKKMYPEFGAILKISADVADRHVENALYQRALGFSHPEEKIFLGKDDRPVVVPTTRHYPPDATSMIFWLKNRQPHLWRDRREVQVTGQVSYEISLPDDMDADIIDVQPIRDALPEGDTHTDADGDGS